MSETNNISPQLSIGFFNKIDDLLSNSEAFIDVRNDPMLREAEDNLSNIEVSDHKLLLSTESFMDMITSSITPSQLQLLQPSISSVGQSELVRSSTIIPSNVPVSGEYNFQIHMVSNTRNTKSVPWAYSEKLNKLFCKMGISCPINIKTDKTPPQNSVIRFTPIYSRFEHAQEIVVRCANHIQCKDFNNNEHPAPSHFVRLENRNAFYEEDTITGRQSVCIPFELPQMGSNFSTCLCQFMCYNSCLGGGKKPIELVITLEINGLIVGRNKIELKICACPGRDIKNEEESSAAYIKKKEAKEKSIKKVKEVQITSIKRNTSVKTADNQQNEEDQIFTLQVKGKTNFQILSKLRDALELQEKFAIEQKPKDVENSNKNMMIINDPVMHETKTQEIHKIEKFLNNLNMIAYLKLFKNAGINTTVDLVKCNRQDIEKLNISDGHTNKIWNEIQKLQGVKSLTPNGSEIEIRKISLKCSFEVNDHLRSFQQIHEPTSSLKRKLRSHNNMSSDDSFSFMKRQK